MDRPAEVAGGGVGMELHSRLLAFHRAGPTALRMVVGAQLRRLREASGINASDAGYAIRATHSKISRMELGRVSFRERDVADLLTMYGVLDEQERSAILSLAREANVPGWWHDSADLLPGWFEAYLGLEEAASVIRNYEVQFVPGLLQTADYARAVVRLGQPGATPAEIEHRVSLRLGRQELLTKPGGPRLWAVVDEAALRRPLGGSEVMRAQLVRLIEATREPNITLQVVPFRSGGHAAEAGAFTIMRFPEPDLPDVVYLEQLTSALYLDKRDDVERYTEVMERLSVESESPERSVHILSGMLEEVRGT
jgi:transcriptional regulator with XRE-family HTH domain